jgi:hypothetical protein
MPGMIGHGHNHPRVPGSKYPSARIHHVTACHSNSTKGTLIIAMVTLMLDKHILVKMSFTM